MPTAKRSIQHIVVTGDVTMDWHIATTPQQRGNQAAWSHSRWTQACWQRGGAALLADVIDAMTENLSRTEGGEYTVLQTGAPREPVHPHNECYHHTYALWSLFQQDGGAAWRVVEHLGLFRSQETEDSAEWKRVTDDTAEAEIVLLDDANLGFRDRPELWPAAIAADARPRWILVKMARPVAKGALWDRLQKHHADRLVVVLPVEDLRRTEVHISRGLSWERTAQDIVWELTHNPRVNALSRCAHVVISFATAGALLLSGTTPEQEHSTPTCFLFFDPHFIEGMFQQHHPGHMIGYTTCLTAGIARQLIHAPENPDIHHGIQSGLSAVRRLHIDGYAMGAKGSNGRLWFPTKRIVTEMADTSPTFAEVKVQDPVRFLRHPEDQADERAAGGRWTILKDRYQANLDWLAERIVREGADSVLQDVPQGRFGHLLTVDRQEIESFRSIHTLVAEYISKERQERPLSIGVFGAPGSGKSFGVTQVAKSLAPDRLTRLEFNLSQFVGPHELVDALHRVRDVTLAGKIPLVFWDEFDTALEDKPLGWLRYFLAPMQDGAFREGQITHPIGPSIFVFAGGTSHCMEDFGCDLSAEERRAAKVPDFASRLKGYVNVLGPNPPQLTSGAQQHPDPYYIIRRAIVLRSLLKRNASHLFEEKKGKRALRIDPGVLRAFLNVSRYKHGIRSIESIIAMSQLSGKSTYERSSLPAEDQLGLHVNGREFLSWVQQIDLGSELLERLAEAAHDVFCEGLRERGYEWGSETDEGKKTHSALVPYEDLNEELKEQNRAYVRDIPNKLAQVGYVMVPSRSDQAPFEFPEGDEDLERLAEMEHNRFVKAKIADGWRFDRERDDLRKQHPALLPWRQMSKAEKAHLFLPKELQAMGTQELPEEEKEKDRDLVRGIPKILARAGYAVVKLHKE